MFQKFKRMCRKAKKTIMQVSTKVRMLIIALLGGIPAMAQSTAGDYSAGTTALSTVAEEIVKYVPVMVKLCYAIAGVVAIIGAIVCFIAAYCLMGFVAGLVVLATVLSAGIVLIILKQRKGLHSKNVKRGVYVYAYSHKV